MSKIYNIYAAASGLFARNGFDGVTMRDVAKASGITMSALYYHFQSKEDLYEEVSEFQFESFLETLGHQWDVIPSAQRVPSQLMGIIFDEVCKDSVFFFMIQRDLYNVNAATFASRSTRRYKVLLKLLEQAVQSTSKAGESDTYAVMLASLIAGYCEFLYADERFRSEQRDVLIQRHRDTMIQVVRKLFDEPMPPDAIDHSATGAKPQQISLSPTDC